MGMLESGATHLGVATDKVIESFRNDMWPGYKSGAGVDPHLMQQFPLLEEGLDAMGIALWAMVELEADDALASAATIASRSPEVERVYICSPDKDLAQCVDGRILQMDRRSGKITDVAGVQEKFGVLPASIPDYLALVGDSADGYPGLPGWGSRSAAAVLAKFGSLDAIPDDVAQWGLALRGADKLSRTLRESWDLALLFRDLARLRKDAPLFESIDEVAWRGPTAAFRAFNERIDGGRLAERAEALQPIRTG
jgi:5'-3' exonuclease